MTTITSTEADAITERMIDEAIAEGEQAVPVAQELRVRRLNGFQEAVAAVPYIAERLATGQQFNAFDSSLNDEDDDDEDCTMYVCIGPVSDTRSIVSVEGRAEANMIADALTFAALSASHPCKSGEGAVSVSEAIRRAKQYAGRVLGISWCNLEEISRVELILAALTPDATQTREAELVAALKAQEDAESARDDCVNCEGEGMWEHCPSCSLTFGRAIDLRRAALNARDAA